MFTSASPISVAELAQLLIARKREGKHTLLFLGSRTGGFFGNKAFYNGLQGYSLRDFSKLSEIEKFDECYQMLKNHLVDEYNAQDPGGKEALEDLLASWLTEVARREEDNYMAQLVKGGFFDIIISTNMDSLLDDAFGRQGMKHPEDYEIVNMLDSIVDVERMKTGVRTMIKVFGKLEHGSSMSLTGEVSWEASQRLMTLLNAMPDRDVLAIGYNPLWDRQVEQALITKGELWYVNEKLPESDSIVEVLEKNKGKYITGLYYSRFAQELHQSICENDTTFMDQSPSDTTSPNVASAQNSERRKVFISYSHKDDEKYPKSLQKYLMPIVEGEEIDIWCDTRFKGGEDWHKEIQKALATTKVAILLVSIDFLTSKYIVTYELPPLFRAADAGEVTLMPILLAACPIAKSELHHYQFINRPLVPLNKMGKANQEAFWTHVAYLIDELLFPERQ